MTATADAKIILRPKITDATSARKELVSFIKNPPSNPIEAAKTFGSMLGAGAVVSAGVTAVFPFAAPILPALGEIFDLFGGGGPSIGEMTLDAIDNLSKQLDEGLKNLQEATENIVKEQAEKTIDTILQGADAIAREQSAVGVLISANVQSVLQETYAEKNQMYIEFQSQMQDIRRKTLDSLTNSISSESKKIADKYNMLLAQISGMIAEIAPAMLDALDGYLVKADAPQNMLAVATDSDALAASRALTPTSKAATPPNNLVPILATGALVAAVVIIGGKKKGKNG